MPYSSVRRSGRLSKQIPIVLHGCDPLGKDFSEHTHTVILSRHGAGIISRHKLLPEQELTLRLLNSIREAEIRVVGEIGSQGNLHTYGVAFLDEQLDFWQQDFPSPVSSTEQPHPLILVCSNCHAPVTIENGDFELDVCLIHGGLVRYCSHCAFATIWRLPPPDDQPAPRVAASAPQSAYAFEPLVSSTVSVLEPPPSPETPQPNSVALETIAESMGSMPSNRRIHRRAKVSYFACIRSEAFGDDVVACIDMSRGGLSFKTKNPYALSTIVRIAVPFAKEAPNAPAIFVPAKIVNS